MAIGGIDWKLLKKLGSLSSFLPFSSLCMFVACSEVPRHLVEMYISSLCVFLNISFFSKRKEKSVLHEYRIYSWGHLASQVTPEQPGFAQSSRAPGIIQHLVLQNHH